MKLLYKIWVHLTKQEIIGKLEKELEQFAIINEMYVRGFPMSKLKVFIETFFTEFEQVVREEIYKRGYADGKNEQPYGINLNAPIN